MAAAGLLACCSTASAIEEPSAWHFGGYGTVGVVHSDSGLADFVATTFQPDGAGYTRRTSYSVDSRLAGQVRFDLNPQWSAVVQVVAEQRVDRSFTPHLEWANVKYQVTPDLAIRVGRITLPIYLAAEYRKLGYASTYVRTPGEVYNRVPITFNDGIDATYRWRAGAMRHQLQASYGNNKTDLLRQLTFEIRARSGIAYTGEAGPLTVRASFITARVTTDIGADLVNAFRRFGPAGTAIADKYLIRDKQAIAYNLSAIYDPGQWYVMAEGGYSDGHSLLIKSYGGYISAGYRQGQFTPFATVAYTTTGEATSVPGLSTASLPPAQRNGALALNAGLNGFLNSTPQQSTLAAGVRWDFMPSAALKLQVEHIQPKAGSRGAFINDQPGFRDGRSVNVTSATLDFVF